MTHESDEEFLREIRAKRDLQRRVPVAELIELLRLVPDGWRVGTFTIGQTGNLTLFDQSGTFMGFVDLREGDRGIKLKDAEEEGEGV